MISSLKLVPEDYFPPLNLGVAVPTANQISELEGVRISAFQISSFDGGEAKGTGNQNYAARIDLGISERLQVSGFIFNQISGHTILVFF